MHAAYNIVLLIYELCCITKIFFPNRMLIVKVGLFYGAQSDSYYWDYWLRVESAIIFVKSVWRLPLYLHEIY